MLQEANITVTCSEMDDSPVEGTRDGRFAATRKVLCDWGDRNTLMAQLVGNALVLPHRYPGRPSAMVSNVQLVPFNNRITNTGAAFGSTLNTFEKAQLTVDYTESEVGTNQDATALVDEDLQPSAEFLTTPATGLHWGAVDGPAVQDVEAPGKLVVMMDWVYTISRTPFVSDASYTLLGHVNRTTIQSLTLGWNFPPETLLYSSINLSRQIFADGPAAWKVTYRFTIKPTGWNKFWRAGANAFQAMFDEQGNEIKPYPLGNFLALTAQRTT